MVALGTKKAETVELPMGLGLALLVVFRAFR